MSTSINLVPLHDKIIVKRLEAKNKTAGGIIIPDSAKEKPIEGMVAAIGDGMIDSEGKKHPLTVKVGDVVLFAKWGGTEIKIDGCEYLIMKESDVLAIRTDSSGGINCNDKTHKHNDACKN